jgi:integrase
MTRKINRLNARSVATIAMHGRHADGGGLYLSISPNGGRRWTFLYRWNRKVTEIGFGSARAGHVTLARARELAGEARAQLAKGVNPKNARKPTEGATFGDCADRLIEAMRPSWRSEKHAAQWKMTLRDYAAPIRKLPVDKITTDDVLSVLNPLWNEKPETASRVRGRIEHVLDAAKARGLRSGENPARWRGHLDQLLAKRQRLTRGHHAAMPFADFPVFMTDLRAHDTVAARALEFAILTAARSGEVLGSTWDEIDLDRGIWTVPPQRMKGGREHRVPLSGRALEILRAMHELQDFRVGDHVFPGSNANKPMSGASMELVLRRIKIEDATVHGSLIDERGLRLCGVRHQGFRQRDLVARLSGPRGNVTRLAERLVKAHHVDAAEFMHLMTVGGSSAHSSSRSRRTALCVRTGGPPVTNIRNCRVASAPCGFTIMPDGLVNSTLIYATTSLSR